MKPIIAGVLAAFLVGCKASDMENASADLPKQYQRSVELGLPTTAADLAQAGRLADAKNGAVYLQQLTELANQKSALRDELVGAVGTMEARDPRRVEAIFTEAKPLFDLLDEAIQAPMYRSKFDLDHGLVLLQIDSPAKLAMQLLRKRAELKAYKGDIEGVIEELGHMGSVASNAGLEPGLRGVADEARQRLVQYSTAEMTADLFLKDPSAIERLTIVLDNEPTPTDVGRALKCDFYAGIATCRNLDQLTSFLEAEGLRTAPIVPAKLRRDSYPLDEKGRAYLARYLEHWNAFFEKAKGIEDPLQLAGIAEDLSVELDKKTGESYKFIKAHKPKAKTLAEAPLRSKHYQRSALAHAQIRLFEAKNGRLPTTLAEAGVAALDPFSNKPYKFKLDGQKFWFWSVGPNKADDEMREKTDDLRNVVSSRPAPR